MEILFTGLRSLREDNPKLTGNTSIWMFPIYGMASFLSPICRRLKGKSIWLRGGVYTCCIFIGEYVTGSFLKKHNACPWDYSNAPLNIDGLIRLDYAPLWFGAGLLFEKILNKH
ncbi:MAG: putative ABC transporter permease [Lachnospiraceae bacterium]|nr:putative ABC transporter permease [Lachnospiraceae bacterium]